MNAQRIVRTKCIAAALACAWLACLPSLARAQVVIQDTFTGGHSTLDASYGGTAWIDYIGACLTAGDGTGSIPACKGLAYYGSGQTWVGGQSGTLPDPVGSGALRFTNGCTGGNCDGSFNHGYTQAGGIVSNFTYPTTAGLQVTFTTMTYEGDSGGGNSDGADGIAFFLLNGSVSPYDLGAFGGSLGYTCSNTNNDSRLHPDSTPRQYDGIIGGYLGLGIDEYGNFLNGITNLPGGTNTSLGDNTATGYGYQPNRIGLRGAGSVSWKSLNATYPSQYPGVLSLAGQALAVQATCKTGLLQDYSAFNNSNNTGGKTYKNSSGNTVAIADYAPIPNAYQVLPTSTVKIANESATNRTQAIPITYKLKISSAGLLSFSYSYNGGATQSVITNQDITAGNGALPASFRFGFAGSTGGSTNVHEVLCFNAAPADTAGSSAGLNEKQTAKVETGSQVYFAFYDPSNWSGALTAQGLGVDASGNVTINTPAIWDASCVLSGVATGQTCITTGVAGPTTAQGPASRAILTWNGTNGVPFEYGASPGLSGTQMTAIDLGDSLSNVPPVTPAMADRVNYLRGNRTNEQTSAGVGEFRQRASVLGDIIDSSPTWVGPPSGPYKAIFTDKIGGVAGSEAGGTGYPAFKAAAATRLNTVWSGANDGLLHGFSAGSYAADGVTYVDNATTPNNGHEVLAYMPAAVVGTIHSSANTAVDFSNPKYGHNYFVDAAPGTGDLFYGTTWHSWVVGGLGPGGGAIYALDVTDPTTFSEGNAANLVKGEWNNTNPTLGTGGISCVGAATCYKSLGNTYGVPQIRRFHNGMWGAVFGNGYGSVNGDAGIFVMLVNPSDATGKTIQFYYLPSGGSTSANGIAYATAADLDSDHIVDYVYAGDLKGNVWRFDLTSSNPASWAVSSGGPLFTTPGTQPITTKLIVVATPSLTGPPRILVEFGTGQVVPQTNTTPTSYASGTQSLYGVWDYNLGTWNTKGSTQYASLASSYGAYTIGTSNLTQQTLTVLLSGSGSSSGNESVSSNPVCWQGSTSCGSGNTQFGWYINLPNSGEQIIYSPVLLVGAFIVNTTIPPAVSVYNCKPANTSGWTIAISPTTGGAFKQSFFPSYVGQSVSGVALSGTGSVSVVTTSGTTTGTFLVTQTSAGGGGGGGGGAVRQINPLATATGTRLTWLERR